MTDLWIFASDSRKFFLGNIFIFELFKKCTKLSLNSAFVDFRESHFHSSSEVEEDVTGLSIL